MESKHTPGPWKLNQVPPKHLISTPKPEVYITAGLPNEPGNRTVAVVHHVDGCHAMNTGRLIAAAPDLLRACEVFAEAYRDYIDGDGSGLDYAARVVKDAIAKAEGGDK